MGTGCSTQNSAAVVPKEEEEEEDEPSTQKQNARQLNRNVSKLGTKKVINSFIVAKTTMRKRESNSGSNGLVTDLDLAGRAMEELKVIQEDKSFRHPRTSKPGHGTKEDISFKLPCGVVQDPSAVLAATPAKLPSDEVEASKAKLASNQDKEVMEGAKYFREQLTVANAPIAQICQAGVVPLLIALLSRDDNTDIQHEVVWSLANLCSAGHDECEHVINQAAIAPLVRLVATCSDDDVVHKAVWALGNMAADCSDAQNMIVLSGALPPLLTRMRDSIKHTALVQRAAWCLSNLARPEPCSDALLEAVPVLELLLGSMEDGECLASMCWTLSYLAEQEEGVEAIAKRIPLLRTLAYLVTSSSSPCVMPALRVLGSACSAPASCANVVSAGGISAFVTHMKRSTLPFVKKECVWALSNIAVSGCENVKRLLDDGVFPQVIQTLHEAGDYASLKRECAYMLSNPFSLSAKVNEETALRLLSHNVVQELAALLSPETPAATLVVAMDGLQDAVKKGQRIIMWKSKQEKAPGVAPTGPPTNPVMEILKEHDVNAKLRQLARHENGDVAMKVNGMINVLQFI